MKIVLPALLTLLVLLDAHASDSWHDIVENKKGTLTFYWYPSNIEVSDSRDIVDGIEHDLAEAFVRYLNVNYNVDIRLLWIETNSFQQVLETVANAREGTFGASSISITAERQEYFNFTPSYLADISVLVSNANIPVIQTAEEFNQEFDGKTAVTIENTTLYSSLNKLAEDQGLHFEMDFVSNSGNIIKKIESDPNSFAYIDLPNFLMSLKNNADIRRQFFHPVKLEGLAFIYTKNSDWTEPVTDYFNSGQYEFDKERIVNKYLGEGVTNTINRISRSAELGPLEEIVISHREKEMQYEELLQSAERDRKRIRTNTILIILSTVVTFSLIIVFIQYRLKLRANQKLIAQQQTIEERNQQLYQLNKDKNDLISLLVHDLRSPLNRIMGISQLFKSKELLPKEYAHLNDICVESSQRMSDMISKILDIDAIESGRHNLKLEEVNLKAIVESVCRDFNNSAQKKSITMKIRLDEDSRIVADKIYLAQVIENLLSNAVKFSPASSTVSVSTQNEGDYLRVKVTDQGPGIPKEEEDKLFKKYQTLSARPTAGEESVGLGLTIVKQYTELMGGKVGFNSKVGEGTTFFIELVKA